MKRRGQRQTGMSRDEDKDRLEEELTRPLPLYSKTMRKYVVQTSIGLLRSEIRLHQKIVTEKERQLQRELDGVACYGDVTLRPSDVFTLDKRDPYAIDDPREWEALLEHFLEHGASEVEDLIHHLRTRENVVAFCRENGVPLPAGYEKSV